MSKTDGRLKTETLVLHGGQEPDPATGARSVIGGNVWLTASVPPDTMVMLETPNLVYRKSTPE